MTDRLVYPENAFCDGEVKTIGTDIDKIIPPVSRFGGGNRTQKKQTVIEKLKAFFEKYFGIGNRIFTALDNEEEEQAEPTVYDIAQARKATDSNQRAAARESKEYTVKKYDRPRRRESDYVFCNVEFGYGGQTYSYLADTDDYHEGDYVIVPVGPDNLETVAQIESIEYHPAEEAPYPLDRIKHIIRKK